MSARYTREVLDAIAYALRTGCLPAKAAKEYGVSVRAVQRGIAAAGLARPRGPRPATVK